MKVYADNVLAKTITQITNGSLVATIEAKLVNYKFELMAGASVVETVDKVACGDAYLIYGQSNAEAGY